MHVVRHTYIHEYDSVPSYEFAQVKLGIPKVIPNIKPAICHDWIELSCWFFAYGYASIKIANWFRYFKQFNNLLFEFWPKISVRFRIRISQIAWFFYRKYLQNGLIFWCIELIYTVYMLLPALQKLFIFTSKNIKNTAR